MCHFIYLLFVCCSEPKEDDGVDVLDVEFCNNCPLTADGCLYGDDFFYCPYITSECLGDSDYKCQECSEIDLLEDNNDDKDADKDPYDDFSECSDAESAAEGFPIGMYCSVVPAEAVDRSFLGAVEKIYPLCMDWD